MGRKLCRAGGPERKASPGLKGAAASHIFVYNGDLFLAQFEQLEGQGVSSRNGENSTGGRGDPVR